MSRIYSRVTKRVTWIANIYKRVYYGVKDRWGKTYIMSAGRQDNNAAIVLGAVILGLLLLKSIFNRNAQGYRCPICDLVIAKNTGFCPRCHTQLDWRGVA